VKEKNRAGADVNVDCEYYYFTQLKTEKKIVLGTTY
jgi:hypothetical protein